MSSKHLVQYVREIKNRPVGVMVAVKSHDGTINIGWSKVNDTFDVFSKKEAKLEALKKIGDGNSKFLTNGVCLCMGKAKSLPHVFEHKINGKSFLNHFLGRVEKYFKKPELPKLVNNLFKPEYTIFFNDCHGVILSKLYKGEFSYLDVTTLSWCETATKCWSTNLTISDLMKIIKKLNIENVKIKCN